MEKIKYVLELKDISKSFSDVIANDHINLKIKKGNIHAILGENGAGKSTLMNILAGLYHPDNGDILVNGRKVKISSPRDSIDLGIGMVHQHFKLVDTINVAENIIIGWHEQKWLLSKKLLFNKIKKISNKYDLPVRPDVLVSDISVGEKQRVEIVKMLFRNAEILILDEPTSVLAPQECEKLFKNFMDLKSKGKTIIFISHKLSEVMEVADTITVLRRGKVIKNIDKTDTNPKELARMMVGREVETTLKNIQRDFKDSETVLKAEKLKAFGDKGEIAINDVSLTIKKGEILAIAGVSGNGQKELAEALTGLRYLIHGKIFVHGKEIKKFKSIEFINNGISHVPADRMNVGSIPSFSCIENVILKTYKNKPIKNGMFINFKEANRLGGYLLKKYDVRMASPSLPVKLLSGGNLQKLILAREISCKPNLIIAVHPTYGLDIAAINMVHNIFLEEQKKGTAILLISEDLEEIMALADEIAVMYRGRLSQKRNKRDCTIEKIGYVMMGIHQEIKEENIDKN